MYWCMKLAFFSFVKSFLYINGPFLHPNICYRQNVMMSFRRCSLVSSFFTNSSLKQWLMMLMKSKQTSMKLQQKMRKAQKPVPRSDKNTHTVCACIFANIQSGNELSSDCFCLSWFRIWSWHRCQSAWSKRDRYLMPLSPHGLHSLHQVLSRVLCVAVTSSTYLSVHLFCRGHKAKIMISADQQIVCVTVLLVEMLLWWSNSITCINMFKQNNISQIHSVLNRTGIEGSNLLAL